MANEHTPFLENVPAYAIGALDAEETVALEAHLRACESCRAELAAYRDVTANLVMTTPPQPPPASLRETLRGQMPHAPKKVTPRPVSWSVGQWALGAAAVVLLGLSLFGIRQVQVLQRQQAAMSRQLENEQAALAMLSYPGAENLTIEGDNVAGRLLLDKERNAAVLVLWDVPSIAQDETYQIWLIAPNGDRTSAGLFRPESGARLTTESILPTQDLSKFTGLGVTVEPAGGSDQPTGPRLFKIDF
jgi:anti-sigma-K factor RskA